MTDPRERLPARAPREVLRELARLQSTPGPRPPQVTLTLSGGIRERGRVLAWAEAAEGGTGACSLAATDDDTDVIYVAARDVVAARVHYTERTVHLMSDGRVSPKAPEAPSRLEMKRRISADGDALGTRLGHAFAVHVPWDALPNEGAGLARAWRALRDTVTVVGALADDPLGRESLADVDALELRRTSTPGVGRDGNRLWVGVAVDDDRSVDVLDAAAIRRELERAL